jgi:hypothetical protein
VADDRQWWRHHASPDRFVEDQHADVARKGDAQRLQRREHRQGEVAVGGDDRVRSRRTLQQRRELPAKDVVVGIARQRPGSDAERRGGVMEGGDARARRHQPWPAHDVEQPPVALGRQRGHSRAHRRIIVHGDVVEARIRIGAVDHHRRHAGRGDQVEAAFGRLRGHHDQPVHLTREERTHASRLQVRISPAQDLHHLVALARGDILEALQQRGEIGARGPRRHQPDDPRLPSPQALRDAVGLETQCGNGVAYRGPPCLADRRVPVEDVGDGAYRHASARRHVADGGATVRENGCCAHPRSIACLNRFKRARAMAWPPGGGAPAP